MKEVFVDPPNRTVAGADYTETSLVYRLRKRAEIRRQIPTRKSVQEGTPDRLADLLEEAATELERLYADLLSKRPADLG